jgi:hypothetical protein
MPVRKLQSRLLFPQFVANKQKGAAAPVFL